MVLRGATSEWLPVTSGVPQGSVLGPLLFLIYINDIDDNLDSSLVKFADDTKIYRRINSNQDAQKLQDDINTMQSWSERWQMKFNPEKCKCVHFGHGNPGFTYKIQGREIESVMQERDLGVLVQGDLDWDSQVAKAVSQGNRILGLIYRTYDDKSAKNILQLYKSLVRPHLEYATQAWRPHKQKHIDLLENVQRRATRMITEYRNMTYEKRLEKSGLLSLEMRRLRADLIQVYKILHGIDDIPTETLFQKSESTQTRGHNLKLYKKHSRLDVRKFFFSQRIISEWNALPSEIVNSGSVNEFKNRIEPLFNKVRSHRTSQRRLPAPLLTASDRAH